MGRTRSTLTERPTRRFFFMRIGPTNEPGFFVALVWSKIRTDVLRTCVWVIPMLRDLQRYLARRKPVDIVYIDRTGRLTQRRVRLLRVDTDHVRAYYYERRAVRTFALINILVTMPDK